MAVRSDLRDGRPVWIAGSRSQIEAQLETRGFKPEWKINRDAVSGEWWCFVPPNRQKKERA